MASSRVTPASGPASVSGPASAPAPAAVAGGPGDREVLRLAPPVVLWWVWVAFVAVNVADYVVQGPPSARSAAVISAIVLLVTALAYTLALRPRVVVDARGLTVVNPFRVHHVPWRLITSVDTGEWVRIRYGDDRELDCWALYVSARAKRKIARGPGRSRRGTLFGSAETARWLEDSGGYGGPSSRLPDEARYLASLPVARAMAIRLGKRAERERARTPAPDAVPAGAVPAGAVPTGAAANWSWRSLAAVVIPALILLAVVLA